MIRAQLIYSRQLLGEALRAALREGRSAAWQGGGAEALALAAADPGEAFELAVEPLGLTDYPVARDPTLPAAVRIEFLRPFDAALAERMGRGTQLAAAHRAAARAALGQLEVCARSLPPRGAYEDLLEPLSASLTYALLGEDQAGTLTALVLGWTRSPAGRWTALDLLHLLSLLPQLEEAYVAALAELADHAGFRLLWRIGEPFALQPILGSERLLARLGRGIASLRRGRAGARP